MLRSCAAQHYAAELFSSESQSSPDVRNPAALHQIPEKARTWVWTGLEFGGRCTPPRSDSYKARRHASDSPRKPLRRGTGRAIRRGVSDCWADLSKQRGVAAGEVGAGRHPPPPRQKIGAAGSFDEDGLWFQVLVQPRPESTRRVRVRSRGRTAGPRPPPSPGSGAPRPFRPTRGTQGGAARKAVPHARRCRTQGGAARKAVPHARRCRR
eukprot:gene16804-biopygen5513